MHCSLQDYHRLSYQKLCSENAHEFACNAENGFSFDFLDTKIMAINFSIKGQSKQCMHTHLPNKLKKFKQTLSARNLMATVF
jgi:hypothetical protein